MNCKAGDLAVIVRKGLTGRTDYIGKIVEVLYAMPNEMFRLPDGGFHQAAPVGLACWVLKFHNLTSFPTALGGERVSFYGCAPDFTLRPIGNEPGEDETLQWAPVPGQKVEVPA